MTVQSLRRRTVSVRGFSYRHRISGSRSSPTSSHRSITGFPGQCALGVIGALSWVAVARRTALMRRCKLWRERQYYLTTRCIVRYSLRVTSLRNGSYSSRSRWWRIAGCRMARRLREGNDWPAVRRHHVGLSRTDGARVFVTRVHEYGLAICLSKRGSQTVIL